MLRSDLNPDRENNTANGRCVSKPLGSADRWSLSRKTQPKLPTRCLKAKSFLLFTPLTNQILLFADSTNLPNQALKKKKKKKLWGQFYLKYTTLVSNHLWMDLVCWEVKRCSSETGISTVSTSSVSPRLKLEPARTVSFFFFFAPPILLYQSLICIIVISCYCNTTQIWTNLCTFKMW